MRQLIVAVVAFAALGVSAFVAADVAGQREQLSLKVLNEIVDKTNVEVNGRCSGTVISEKGYILTAAHCVEHLKKAEGMSARKERKSAAGAYNPGEVVQYTSDGYNQLSKTSYPAKVVASAPEYDLAVMLVQGKFGAMSRVLPANETPVRGEAVWAVGNPALFYGSVSKGVVSRLLSSNIRGLYKDEIAFVQFSAPIFGGNSGGSLYNKDGLLIGVPVAMIGGTSIAWAVSNQTVWRFLSEREIEP